MQPTVLFENAQEIATYTAVSFLSGKSVMRNSKVWCLHTNRLRLLAPSVSSVDHIRQILKRCGMRRS